MDKDYDFHRCRDHLKRRGIRDRIARRGIESFALLPKHWVVEHSFAWAACFRQLAKDYEKLPDVLPRLHFLVFAILTMHLAKKIQTMHTA